MGQAYVHTESSSDDVELADVGWRMCEEVLQTREELEDCAQGKIALTSRGGERYGVYGELATRGLYAWCPWCLTAQAVVAGAGCRWAGNHEGEAFTPSTVHVESVMLCNEGVDDEASAGVAGVAGESGMDQMAALDFHCWLCGLRSLETGDEAGRKIRKLSWTYSTRTPMFGQQQPRLHRCRSAQMTRSSRYDFI